jgi:zinc transporter 1/2/3
VQRWLLLAFTACTTPIGIAIGIGAESVAGSSNLKLVNAIALSLASGSFAYISLLQLLPSSLANNRLIPYKLLLFVGGFLAMSALAVFV